MKTAIISATKETDVTKTLLYQSLLTLRHFTILNPEYEVFMYPQNSLGLSAVYNAAIDSLGPQFTEAIFVHDDVYLDDINIISKVRDGLQVYDIVGVAGGSTPNVVHPALWHIMTKRETHRGFVGHFNKDNTQVYMTSFGAVPSEVDILDGVFLGVNCERVKRVKWRFNEGYTFHHYDLSSCLDARALGLKLGVLPVHMVHKSPGLLDINDPVFVRSNQKFLLEYGSTSHAT